MFQVDSEFDLDDDYFDDAFDPVNKENPPRGDQKSIDDSPCPRNDRTGPPTNHGCSTSEARVNQLFLNAWKSHEGLNTPKPSANRTLDILQVVEGNNALDTSCVSNVRSSTRNVRTRKFPGPAGLLPERQGNTSLIATEEFLLDLESEKKDLDLSVPEVGDVLSQESSRSFEVGCWGAMLSDLGNGLASGINVKGVRSKARHSRSLKVPAMALLLQTVDSTLPDPCLTLKDATGEMFGTLHRDVWERYGDRLEPGAVLVLRSVGVISAGITSKRHYLNITANNIATLYCTNREDQVLRINVNPILRGDVSRLLDEWDALVVAPPPNLSPVTSSSLPPSPRLFSTVTDGDTSRVSVNSHRSVPVNRQPYVPPRMNRSFNAPPRPSFRAVATPRPAAPNACPPRPQTSLQQPPKRPRFESAQQTPPASNTTATPSPRGIFSVPLNNTTGSDVVDDLLDSIDADSIFDDF